MAEDKSFWVTIPGILTGIAAVITASVGAYKILSGLEEADLPSSNPAVVAPTNSEVTECDDVVNRNWGIAQAHMGQVTDAISDCLVFQDIVFEVGCLGHPYTLNLNGKQNINRFTITVTNQWPYSPSLGEDYIYREYVGTIDAGAEMNSIHGEARRLVGPGGTWEIVESP